MENAPAVHITKRLVEWGNGDKSALDDVLPLIQSELRRLAHHYMSRERPGHTLQTTALVNEAYLRLVGQNVSWQSRSHFYGIAAQMMRRILVDYARGRLYAKRGGGAIHVSLEKAKSVSNGRTAELTALDEALKELERIDPRQARVVELRFFGGLTIKETADVMEISTDTVKSEWSTAKAWLYREMSCESNGQG
jgi:RNA polymerase sigma factor, TIGR02999 family